MRQLASEAVALDYLRGTSVPSRVLDEALVAADIWIGQRVQLNGSVPPCVSEAASLLAAVIVHHPEARFDEAAVPNMVRLMLMPSQ